MKDTIIKGTGNSRYLRSNVSADITFFEFVALLRAGKLPIDLAGINADGIDILGTALGKENLLSEGTELFLFGSKGDRTPNEAFVRLAPWTLIDTIDNTVGYSGEWTAPDVFGDGSAYDLGAYMIGGGGSGGVQVYNNASFASGGASGYGKNIIVQNVAPGTNFPWVIGQGGAGVTKQTSGSGGVTGNTGGTTSFNGETASGGEGGGANTNAYSGANGGQGSDGGTIASVITPRNLFGCAPTYNGKYADSLYPGGLSQSPRDGQNMFDPTMLTLCAGGCIGVRSTSIQNPQVVNALPDGTKGGDGRYSTSNITGYAATGYGNGGGGVIRFAEASTSNTATSGAGSDGVIFLYARKAVS